MRGSSMRMRCEKRSVSQAHILGEEINKKEIRNSSGSKARVVGGGENFCLNGNLIVEAGILRKIS